MFMFGGMIYLLIALLVAAAVVFAIIYAIYSVVQRRREARELEEDQREWDEI